MHLSSSSVFLLIALTINPMGSLPISEAPHVNQNQTHPHNHSDTYAYSAEARIILPKNDNDGNPLTEVQLKLEDMVSRKYGGFTRFDSFGGWYSTSTNTTYGEDVWVYDIAVANPNTAAVRKELYDLAVWLRVTAKQEAVYLRYPYGGVQFV